MPKRRPGEVRDAILAERRARGGAASVQERIEGVRARLGEVAPSSVRSYLNLNTGELFERQGRGHYRLTRP